MTKSKGIKPVRSRGTLAENAITPQGRGKSLLASSPATAKAALERSGTPLILPSDVKLIFQGLLSHRDVLNLAIDTRYQREEITSEVNMLIHVLNHGGQIPDPVTVAERRDKSRWVVDGQQRFWAHVDTGKPMQVRIFAVDTYEQELTLFHVLNNARRLTAKTKLRSWPGPSGDAITKLDTADDSPLRGLLGHTKGDVAFPVVTVMRGLAVAASGVMATGAIERVCSTFDRAYEKDRKWVEKAVKFYSHALAGIFDKDTPLRHLSAIALGRVCYATWRPLSVDDAWPMPSMKQVGKLKKLDWDRLAPGFAIQWLPVLVANVKNIWTEAADPDEFARSKVK